MSKVADIRLGWKKSVSADVAKVVVRTTVNGTETTVEGGPETEELVVTGIAAMSACQFKVETWNSEGLMTTSLTHDFVLGDLEAPAPATDLFHEVVAIRDVPD